MAKMSRLAALVFTALAVVIVSPSQSDALKDVPGAGAAVPVPSAAVGDLAYKHASFNNTKFDTVQVCWPWNTLIQPGKGYTIDIQAERSVLAALAWKVHNGTLSLFTTADVATHYPVNVVVSLPAKAFTGLYVTSPLAEVTVAPRFTPPDYFVIAAAFTASNIWVLDIDTPTVNIFTSGLGTVLVNGSFVNATVVASGVSDVYLSGLKGTAMANLAGAADLLVNASVGTAQVLGQASGSSAVLYSNCECSVDTPFLFGAPCQQMDSPVLPDIDPSWSCGLDIAGAFTCPPGGTLAALVAASLGVLPMMHLPAPVTVLASATVIPNFPEIIAPDPWAAVSQGALPSLADPGLVSTVGQMPEPYSGGGASNPLSGSTSQAGMAGTVSQGKSVPGSLSAAQHDVMAAAGGRRRLRESASFSATTGFGLGSAYEGSLLQTGPGLVTVQTLPCFYNDVGGVGALDMFP